MLVDTASLYFRAFHGVPESMTAPDGSPVNAVRGLLDMLATLVASRRPDDLVACWDEDWRPAFRVAAIPTYKAHRLARPGGVDELVPAALVPQVDIIIDVLAALGVARVGAPGYEADDVLGTLATRAAADAHAAGEVADVEVVSGDRDLFQLVDDAAGVRVLYVGRGVRNLETVDQAWLRARHGVPTGAAYADMAVLRGDTSDGLPGVPGIGDKTAAGLITRFGGLEALLEAVAAGDGSIAPGQRRKLTDAAAYLAAAPAVVRVVRDIDLPRVEATVPREPADPVSLLALVERWGIGSSVQRFLRAVGWTGDSA
jgi:5'-3' exonuclease